MSGQSIMATADSVQPPSLTSPKLVLGSEWFNHPGYLHGLTQPSVSGWVYVSNGAMPSDLGLQDLIHRLTGLESSTQQLFNRHDAAPLERWLSLYQWVQRENKIPVFSSALTTPEAESDRAGFQRFRLFLPCHHPDLGLAVLAWCARVMNLTMAWSGQVVQLNNEEAQSLQAIPSKLVNSGLKGINNFHLIAAAHELGIQVTQLSTQAFIYGWGSSQKTLQSTLTDLTPHLGVRVSQSKQATSRLLRSRGIPVPAHVGVKSLEEALAACTTLGFPVVIKPDDQDQGRGVFSNLPNFAAVENAYREATAYSHKIVVEKHVDGEDYRISVVGQEVVKIILRRPGGVLGDGKLTVQELVTEAQKRVDLARHFRLTGTHLIQLDSEAIGLMEERGFKTHSILPANLFLPLRRKSNVSTGGSQFLVDIATVHPDNLQLAVRATRCVGLDLAGVDLICPDLSQSWLNVGACVIEVNSKPQISIIHTPTIYQDILTRLLPPQNSVRVCLLILPNDCPVPSSAVLRVLAEARDCATFVSQQGAWTGQQCIFGPQHDGFLATRMVMFDEHVRSLMCVMHANELIRHGSPFLRLSSVEHYPALQDKPEKAAFEAVESLLSPSLQSRLPPEFIRH